VTFAIMSLMNPLVVRCLIGFLWLAIVLLSGCSGPPKVEHAKTWPVKGKVVKNGQPLTAGTIEFQPAGSGERASGEIGQDGAFSLFTFAGNEKLDGAVEGKYRVTVIPPIPADQQNVQIFNLPKTLEVKPQENEFTIDVGKK